MYRPGCFCFAGSDLLCPFRTTTLKREDYTMKLTSFLFFGAGVAFGIGVMYAVKSDTGKRIALALASKGYELKGRLASMADEVKDTVGDVVSEARNAVKKQDAQAFGAQ